MGISPKKRYYLLACLWPLGFFMNGLMFSMPPLIDILRADLQITYEQSGLLFSVPLLMLILFSLPSGWLGDAIGPATAIGIGATLVGLGSILRGISMGFCSLMIFISIYGVGWALILSNVPKMLRRVFPGENLGTVTGIFTTSIVAGPGFVLFLTRALVLPQVGSWRGTLILWGALALAASGVWWLASRNLSSQVQHTRNPAGTAFTLRDVLQRDILLAGLVISVINLIFYGVSAWLGLFLEDRGSSHQFAAFVVSVCGWSGIIGNLLLPRLSDKLGLRRPLLFVGSVIMGVGCLSFLFLPAGLTWLAALVLGVFIAGSYSIALILPAETMREERVALGTGVVLSVGYVGGFVGPWIGGVILDSQGTFAHLVYVLAGTALIMFVAALRLRETGSRGRARVHAP